MTRGYNWFLVDWYSSRRTFIWNYINRHNLSCMMHKCNDVIIMSFIPKCYAIFNFKNFGKLPCQYHFKVAKLYYEPFNHLLWLIHYSLGFRPRPLIFIPKTCKRLWNLISYNHRTLRNLHFNKHNHSFSSKSFFGSSPLTSSYPESFIST